MEKPDTLITLLGSNPLVPVTAIKVLAEDTTKVYIILTENTTNIFDRILLWRDKHCKHISIEGIVVDPFNHEVIVNELSRSFEPDKIKGIIHFDTTGGSKQMMLGTLSFLQQNIGVPDSLLVSYIVSSPWELFLTNLSEQSTIRHSISSKFKINEIISLHQDEYKSWDPWANELKDDVAGEIALIKSDKQNAEIWDKWKKSTIMRNCYKGGSRLKKEAEIRDTPISFDQFNGLGMLLNNDRSKSLTLSDLRNKLQFRRCGQLCDWFNGFWLETYVALQFNKPPLNSFIDDIKVNIKTKNPEFELDNMVLVQNRLYVISISTTTDSYRGGKSDLKKKLFEVIIRSRQIGGWKTYFGLVCLSDSPDVLSREVDDYLVDRKVKIFGRSDLLDLGEKMKEWMNSSYPTKSK